MNVAPTTARTRLSSCLARKSRALLDGQERPLRRRTVRRPVRVAHWQGGGAGAAAEVTIVTISCGCMPAKVVEKRESEGISIQVIDLQSLVRLDREAIVVASAGAAASWSTSTTGGSGFSGEDIAGVAEHHLDPPSRCRGVRAPLIPSPTLASSSTHCSWLRGASRGRCVTRRALIDLLFARCRGSPVHPGSSSPLRIRRRAQTRPSSPRSPRTRSTRRCTRKGGRSSPCWSQESTQLHQGSVIPQLTSTAASGAAACRSCIGYWVHVRAGWNTIHEAVGLAHFDGGAQQRESQCRAPPMSWSGYPWRGTSFRPRPQDGGEGSTKMRPLQPDSSTAAAAGVLLPSGYPCEEVTAARTAAATAGATLASNTLGTM